MKINSLKMMCMQTLEKNSGYLEPLDNGLAETIINSVASKLKDTRLYDYSEREPKERTWEQITNDVCNMFPGHAKQAEMNFSYETPYIISVAVDELDYVYSPPYLSSLYKLIDSGISPNIRDNEGNGILHHIFRSEYFEELDTDDQQILPSFQKALSTIQHIINSGADVNALNNNGNSPLYLCRVPTVVTLLLKNNADPNLTNCNRPPLFALIDDIYQSNMRGEEVDNETYEEDLNNLRCNIDLMRMLVNGGADINFKNENGQTPLEYAIDLFKNSSTVVFPLVKTLVNLGATHTFQQLASVMMNQRYGIAQLDNAPPYNPQPALSAPRKRRRTEQQYSNT